MIVYVAKYIYIRRILATRNCLFYYTYIYVQPFAVIFTRFMYDLVDKCICARDVRVRAYM